MKSVTMPASSNGMSTSIDIHSIMSLRLEMRVNDNPLSTGTGFVAFTKSGKPVLLTNRHNVTGRDQNTGKCLSMTAGIPDEIRINHNVFARPGVWVWTSERLTKTDGSPRWLEHPKLGATADFIALPLTDTYCVQTFPYNPRSPGAAISIKVADVVSVIGFPFGLSVGGSTAVWATGFVASEPEIDYNGLPTFLIDCRTRQGQSGSAVVAHRNGGMVAMMDGSTAAFVGPITRFLGIYSGRVNSESDIGLVWKASAVAELLDSVG